ncbi:MAG: DUF4358 domain-containing protein [Clostridiales bacterium]|nr:DUF4358 domain-containing protein [Clostridiales bacterium]
MNRFKKFSLILLIIILSVIPVVFVSCSDESSSDVENDSVESTAVDVDVKSLLTAALAGYTGSDMPELQYYYNDAAEDDDEYLDEGTAGVLFYDDFIADVSLLDSADSYAMAVPAGKRVFEIDVFKAPDSEKLADIKKLLEDRLSVKANGDVLNYTPEEEPMLDGAEVYTAGNFAILVATADNTIAKNAISAVLNPVSEAVG